MTVANGPVTRFQNRKGLGTTTTTDSPITTRTERQPEYMPTSSDGKTATSSGTRQPWILVRIRPGGSCRISRPVAITKSFIFASSPCQICPPVHNEYIFCFLSGLSPPRPNTRCSVHKLRPNNYFLFRRAVNLFSTGRAVFLWTPFAIHEFWSLCWCATTTIPFCWKPWGYYI